LRGPAFLLEHCPSYPGRIARLAVEPGSEHLTGAEECRQMIDRLGIVRPPVQAVLDKLKAVPVDNHSLDGWEKDTFDLEKFRREALKVLEERKKVNFDHPDSSDRTPARGAFEQAVLLAIIRLGADAYGRAILKEVQLRLERDVAAGAVHATLERLQARGLIASRLGSGTAVRGGRARRFYRLQPAGLRALNDARATVDLLWHGLEWPLKGMVKGRV
jgi:DNA-binding PadR family transcriptional regulator